MLSKTPSILLAALCLVQSSVAFTVPSPRHVLNTPFQNSRNLDPKDNHYARQSSMLQMNANNAAQELDLLLDQGKLGDAEAFLKLHPDLVTLNTKERWTKIFSVIEQQTAEETLPEQDVNLRNQQVEFPETSQARTDMTQMYQTLSQLGQLRVYGAIPSRMPIAAGSHAVRPALLEEITNLPMKALTPKQSNALLYAGAAAALLEGIASVALNVDLNLLVLATLAFAITDRLLLNGALVESFYKLFSPGIQTKIQRHEAGHFLAAYLLGCPVEGCVLDAWAALQDSRFGLGRQVTAGTSFFDPLLSQQINGGGSVTRSSIDRYSIIVMAGIAAEAVHYGQADGGAGDEMALIAFLSQLNGGSAAWNNVTIRNQARWGALQAVLILREYKPCYEALVEALEAGGDLGECIYAIEKAAQDNGLGPLKEPVGYIVELPGDEEIWTTENPESAAVPTTTASNGTPASSQNKMDPQESLAKLNEYRLSMEEKLKAIDEKLDGFQ